MIGALKYAGMVLLINATILAQPQPRVRTDPSRQAGAAADSQTETGKWRFLLDQLVIDARTLTEENLRSAALNAVADAYWELSQPRARELFAASLELALTIEVEKDRQAAVNQVIYSAAKRDRQLGQTLTKKMLERNNANHQPLQAALDLLQTDAEAAEAVAMASTARGASFDSAWFLFQLQKHNPQAADRVYTTLLNNENSRSLRRLLWLSGYPFGYGEAFGGGPDPLQFSGISGFDFGELKANPALAMAFLKVADESVLATLNQVATAPPEQVEVLTSLAFFTLSYLLPEVEKYRPDLYPRWIALQTNVSQRINPHRREEILSKIKNILSERERVRNRTTDEQDFSDEALENAEKLASTCQRDIVFAKAALKLSYKNNFKRAMQIADRVSAIELRSNILQFVYYDSALDGMPANSRPDTAQTLEYANRVTAPEQRALLLLKLVTAMLKHGDDELKKELLLEATKLAERVTDPDVRAGVMLAVANQFPESDPDDRFRMLKRAVAAVNSKKDIKIDKFLVERRVNLTCVGTPSQWYGESLAQVSLIDSILQFSQLHEDQAMQVAQDLGPGINRVRALAAIAGSAIKKPSVREKQVR